MSTQTNPTTGNTAEIRITVSTIAGLTTTIVNGEKAAAKSDARFVEYATELRKESDKHSYDESTARLLIQQCYLEAKFGYKVELAKLGQAKNAKTEIKLLDPAATYTVADVKQAIDKSVTFDVSKVMALAYPQAPDELKAAYSHNAPIKDYRQRIGVNDLLKIARGSVTLADYLNPPAAPETPAPAASGAAPGAAPAAGDASAPAPTPGAAPGAEAPQTPAPSQGGGPLSLADRFEAATSACKNEGLSYPEMVAILDRVFNRTK